MSLVSQLNNAMVTIGTVTKALRQSIGTLASLNTTTKTDIVSAINEVSTARAADTTAIGTLASLTTTAKGNLVAAVNEVKASISGAGAVIDDAAPSTSKVYSSQKTEDKIAAAVTALVNAAPGALDTLGELAAQLATDESAASALTTAVANRLRFDAAQSLTSPQKVQGQANLDVHSTATIGDPTTDFATAYTTANT